jgi:hypothetical protein
MSSAVRSRDNYSLPPSLLTEAPIYSCYNAGHYKILSVSFSFHSDSAPIPASQQLNSQGHLLSED